MYSREELLDKLMERVGEQAITTMRDVLGDLLEKEFNKALTESLMDQSFSRTVIDELRDGLSAIYKEISRAKQPNGTQAVGLSEAQAKELFNEASDQLDQILKTTEQATVNIMDIVERHLDLQMSAGELIDQLEGSERDNATIQQLKDSNRMLNEDLMQIMTALSFQDLTGQRIKRIIEALRKVESTVFDLYMSTGLTLKAHAAEPGKDIGKIKEESKQKVSKLKGPQQDAASQDEVDDMLAQLGLD